MERWVALVGASRLGTSEEYIRVVCKEIVERARILSLHSFLRFPDVAEFLLDRALAWAHAGLPLNQIGSRLPKTLDDLGALKIAEGGRDGGPLSSHELKQVKRIIQ